MLHPASPSTDSAHHCANCTIWVMAAPDNVFIAALLLMTMLSISHRGVSAQGNGCSNAINSCVYSVSGKNEFLCKSGMFCIDKLSICAEEVKEEAKQKLIEKGCSGSGVPIISAMSLFVAALFHMF